MTPSETGTSRLLWLAVALSGAAALIYQVLWVRQLGDVLGHGTMAVLVVLSVFFGGLGVGARWLGARADRARAPLRLFAALELGIAACGLAFVPLAAALAAAYVSLAPAELPVGTALAVKTLCAVAMLALPTVLMGGTLPAALRGAGAESATLGRTVSRIYGWNTFGAACGCVLVTFALLPLVGVWPALQVAAALNAAAAALAWRIAGARRESAESRPRSAPDVSPAGADADAPAGAARLYLVAALGTGFVSLGLELAWTRALGLRMTSSVYSFAIILAAFLVALAAGAWVVARLDRRVGITRASCGALIGLGAVGAWLSIRVLAWLGESAGAASFAGVQARELATAFAVMAVPGLCLGASFPALIRLANRELASLGTDVGRVYLWNTVGAVTGPPLVGLVLLPRLGTTATITLLGAVSLGLGLLLARPRPAHTAALVAAGGALALACWADLRFWNAADGDVLRSYREGLGASVAVVDRKDGTRLLKVGAYRLGDDVAVYPQRRQGLLPLLLHPEPSTALMLGLGTGTSTAGVLGHGGVAVDNLELLPDVVAALPWFEHVNDQLAERAQRDSAVRVLTVDARHFVRATERRYDVVIGDLFVPWRRGEGAMFTVEHFRAVRDVLTQGGLFVQWLPLYQLGEEDLAIIVRTFCEAFPHASAWWLYFNPQSATLGLAGSRDPQRIDTLAYRDRIADPRRQRFFAENGFDSLGKLAASWIAGRETLVRWAQDAPIESRLRPQTEFGAPHRRLRGTRELVRRNVEVLLGWSEEAQGTEPFAGWSDADRDVARRYRGAARHYFQGRLALLFDSSGRAALEQYLAALALAPDWIWIERNVQRTADRAIEAGELDLARRAADALLAQPPSASAGHYLRARLALAAGDTGRARDELIAALELRPGHAESGALLQRLHR